MFKKLNKKGFTLAELLVVVAIIGVLVAISIPIFTGQLEKAREATDAANIRAAYAAVSTDMLLDSKELKDANGVEYKDGVYTATVTATQKEDNWQTLGTTNNTYMEIGGQKVAVKKNGDSWTITGTVSTGVVAITPNDKTTP